MESNKSFSILNLAVLIFSITALICLVVDTLFPISAEVSKLLKYFDYLLCTFFFCEFLYQFVRATSKKEYLKWGWIDLLSSIPIIDTFRFARVIRIIRIIRIVRAFKSIKEFLNHIYFNKAKGALSSVMILAFLILIFSSIAILQVENTANGNIKTAEDAIWWAYTTVTTVGYGDKYPVTSEGRMIAIFLMTFGVGMFGTFTAYIASLFVKPSSE
ncbi:potassium channel family protein [Flavobacterium sp.]|jgi:voltage-gated potassium channel|uniref:potassium channel family protein n=1 Tax=Flavobacterium sp. TaxID=239 RepID=UPI0037BFAA42